MSGECVTYEDAEQALLRMIVQGTKNYDSASVRAFSEALVALQQARTTEKAAVVAAADSGTQTVKVAFGV